MKKVTFVYKISFRTNTPPTREQANRASEVIAPAIGSILAHSFGAENEAAVECETHVADDDRETARGELQDKLQEILREKLDEAKS